MKVLRLTSSNVKRLQAVEITPGEETTVIIGGVNGAGKSSVLDAISMALGGAALVPDEPIRSGEREATTEVDLGDIVVTRKFKKVPPTCTCPATDSTSEREHLAECPVLQPWKTTSSLIVRNKDGAVFSSPQAMLDKLVGKLTFDPLAFSRMHPTEQKAVLVKLVGLDTSALDNEYGIDYAGRAQLNKQLAEAQVKLKNLPRHEGAPVYEVDISAIADEIKKADELRTIATEAVARYEAAKGGIVAHEQHVDGQRRHIAKLEQELREAKETLERYQQQLTTAREDIAARESQVREAQAAVPDTLVLNQQLRDAQATNKRVQDNRKHDEQGREVSRLKGEIGATEARMKKNLADKQAKLVALKFPVEGLGFNEHGVTYNGVPLQQASTAEKIRISVAIGLALNPKLRVLLVRDGSLLDDGTIKAITEQAKAADAQLWLEYMTQSKDGVTVMIEDGQVV